MQGYIKLHRVLMEKPIWQKSTPEQKVILITLLTMANHKPNEWEWQGQKFVVKEGQFITSLESITKRAGAGISIKNVRTALERFEKYEFLANESTKQGRLITIENWGLYQCDDEKAANEPADGRQTGGKRVATNKNDKNDKNDKKKRLPKKSGQNFGQSTISNLSPEQLNEIVERKRAKKNNVDT